MSIVKEINHYRKAVMKRLTKHLGQTRLPSGRRERETITRILISRPNHRLGNLLLVTPLLQELMQTLPDAKIDLFVKGGLGRVLFANYPNVNRVIQLPKKPLRHLGSYLAGWIALRRTRYDIVMNVVNHSSSGRISAHFANADYKFLGEINEIIESKYTDHAHMAKYPVYSFRNYIGQLGYPVKERPVPALDLRLSAAEVAAGKKVLDDLVHDQRRTICLYTYATGAKLYPPSWWEPLYAQLQKEFPDYHIVELLPVENVSQLSFKAPSFYSKDLRLIGGFLANTAIFIGGDSGMMHLASASGVPTVGLFKTTNMNVYAPYGHNSVGVNTEKCDADTCINIVKRILQLPYQP